MGAFSGVTHFFDCPLDTIAEKLHYDEDNLLILRGDLTTLREKYPQTYSNLCSCQHHADRRTLLEYGQDVIASWIFEDVFLDTLKDSKSFSVTLAGADRLRKLLPRSRTSASSDYLLKTDILSIKLELMCDYTGYWAQKEKLHLRDNKYNKLQTSGSLFVAMSVANKEFAIFDFRRPIPAKYIPMHPPYGNKPAYELSIPSRMMHSYTATDLIAAIEQIL